MHESIGPGSSNEKEQFNRQSPQNLSSQGIIGPRIHLTSYPHLAIVSNKQINSSAVKTKNRSEKKRETIEADALLDDWTIHTEGFQMLKAHERKGKNKELLKRIVKQQKVKVIVQNFSKKISRNNTQSNPVDYTPFVSPKKLGFFDTQGIQLSDYLNIFFFITSVLLIMFLSISSTLSLVFEEVGNSSAFKTFSFVCLVYFIFQIGLNLATIKFEQGKRLGTLRQIWNHEVRKNLLLDILTIIVLFVDQFAENSALTFMRLIFILKIGQAFKKIEKLEIFCIKNFYYEQYWSLIKIFLFNFSMAHILALCLVAMAGTSEDENWMNYKDICLAPWPQKYAWAYYWATTTMLTVGSGNLNATNHVEAIVLTMIEMISCIALAYNINCVGMLISKIRQQDVEKGKDLKVFQKLSRKNDLTEELEWKINNYIEESSNIKKKSNHEEESVFVEKLPKGLKKEFLKQSNKKIFQTLPFFKSLMESTLFNFAQKIEIRVSHPEQIIQNLDDPHNLLILKGGQIGFTCKKTGCDYNSTVIDRLKILNLADPILISLGFIRNPRLSYEIKSLAYSVLYFLGHEDVLSILKGSQTDHELYCHLRDKSQNMPDEFELFVCETCRERHTKFTCPKLHYIPIKQNVTDRHIYKVKHSKSKRSNQFPRIQKFLCNPLKIYTSENKQLEKAVSTIQNKKDEPLRRQTDVIRNRGFQHIVVSSSDPLIKEISDIKDFLQKNTAELRKAFLNDEGHDEVWIVETDKMKDYKRYFEVDNSCGLIEKFCVTKRGIALKGRESLSLMKS